MVSFKTLAENFRFAILPSSIGRRLADACWAVEDIRKQGNNGEFAYLRIYDITEALRVELYSRGLLLIPSDVEVHEQSFETETPGRWITETRVKTAFTITDGNRKSVHFSFGKGRDMDGHSLAIAQTAAMKAWLKRLGFIFGDADDPEKISEPAAKPLVQRAQERGVAETPKQLERLKEYRRRTWDTALHTSKRTPKQVEQLLSLAFGFDVTSEDIVNLEEGKFELAVRLLYSLDNDLEGALELSRQAVTQEKQRRPIPIKED